jgi:hypothetical protein
MQMRNYVLKISFAYFQFLIDNYTSDEKSFSSKTVYFIYYDFGVLFMYI